MTRAALLAVLLLSAPAAHALTIPLVDVEGTYSDADLARSFLFAFDSELPVASVRLRLRGSATAPQGTLFAVQAVSTLGPGSVSKLIGKGPELSVDAELLRFLPPIIDFDVPPGSALVVVILGPVACLDGSGDPCPAFEADVTAAFLDVELPEPSPLAALLLALAGIGLGLGLGRIGQPASRRLRSAPRAGLRGLP